VTDLPSLLYTDDETDLRAALRDFLASRATIDSVLARVDLEPPEAPLPLWTGLARELDVLALPLAGGLGGADATWLEAAVVLEELGRSVADVPFFTSSVMAGALLSSLGADEQLSWIADGRCVFALAVPFTSPLTSQASVAWDGQRLSGTVPAVAGAVEATHLLVPVASTILLVNAEPARVTPLVSLDMTRRLADVDLEGALAEVLADGPEVAAALARTQAIASALLASEQLGVAEHTFDTAVRYLSERRQFGRTIGSYQALKHRVADTWTALVQARAVARYAAACAAGTTESARADLPVAAALAQAVCGPVAVRAAEEGIQLHGGIGFTWELPEHLYLKRARVDALALGTPAWHRRQLAGLVGLTGTGSSR
jgi:alkylation response protein AidB-like acyl-CoA dehydrogenase